LDIIVTSAPDETAWLLTDLLGRPMGQVKQDDAGAFRLVTAGQALETMKAMKHGPFASLDAALAEIERFTRGSCRRAAESQDERGNPSDLSPPSQPPV
jgi:hypothetical protein